MCLQVVEDLQTSLPTQFVQQIFSVDSPLLQLRYTSSPKVSILCTLLIPSAFHLFSTLSVGQSVFVGTFIIYPPLIYAVFLFPSPFFSSTFLFLFLLHLRLSLSLPLFASSLCSPPLPPPAFLLPSIIRFFPSW